MAAGMGEGAETGSGALATLSSAGVVSLLPRGKRVSLEAGVAPGSGTGLVFTSAAVGAGVAGSPRLSVPANKCFSFGKRIMVICQVASTK